MAYGGGPWGSLWGSGGGSLLSVLLVQPVRENVVRVFFSENIRLSGIFDPTDGSDPTKYTLIPIAGTLYDGGTPRSVSVASIEVVSGSIIDVVTDRPFDGYPGRYMLTLSGIVTEDGNALSSSGPFEFDGLYKFKLPLTRPAAIPNRDIANPQSAAALIGTSIVQTSPDFVFGTIPADESGDYAFDEGVASLKKRITRRLLTLRGRFGHLPNYGVGVGAQLKRGNLASVRAQLAADAERQVREEPEVERASVTIVADPTTPGLVRFRLRVRARKLSDQDINMDVPFSPTET